MSRRPCNSPLASPLGLVGPAMSRLSTPSFEPRRAAMTTTLLAAKVQEPADAIEEFSLSDVLRARDDGVDFRTAASMFAGALEHFESKGHNLYRRMLLQPSDAEALVDYPREAGERRMIILASNNYLGLASHPK